MSGRRQTPAALLNEHRAQRTGRDWFFDMRAACPRRPRAVIIIPLSNAVVFGEHKREIKVLVTQERDVNNGHRARPEVPDQWRFRSH